MGDLLCLWFLLSGGGTLLTWRWLRRHGKIPLATGHAVLAFWLYQLAVPPYASIRIDLFLSVPLFGIIVIAALVELVRTKRQRRE